VIGLLIMNAMTYGLGLAAYLWDKYTFVPTGTVYPSTHPWMRYNVNTVPWLSSDMRTAAEMGLLFVVLAAAVFGGSAFALERRERSADFLAMLPVKRRRIIASKLLVSFALLGSFLAVEMGVLRCSDFVRSWETFPDLLMATFNFAAAGIAIFAIAWLLSTFLSSTAIAASVAILLVGCVDAGGYFIRANAMKIEVSAAVIFILIGNAYYLRRVAP
jgi:hypothetical protein